ncbi:MAG: glycosyl hydrolase [Caldilineaceae bacterium SB0662_bin_9]|uniref:Glycosyl hydrolase n=1 Tax=Caldilineaceae bacterium SB0662_bin_9 TaxID=2605258 RepID=A0A6B1DR09_9CHLR|nr:glycosyl hydrolase [Caldilineaceae bacterium SB0662_bin_9]
MQVRPRDPLPVPTDLKERCSHALAFAATQVRNLTERHPDLLPLYTRNGLWNHEGEAWTNWCEGFVAGQMWILYRHTRDPFWKDTAIHYSNLLRGREHDRNVHDLGFIFWSSWKRWYDETGDEALQDVIVQAGRTMGMRFKEQGQYLRSFVSDESIFIDIMMNVGIIFHAALVTGDEELWNRVHAHCHTSRRYLVRGDGSTSHEGIFDLETGAFLRQTTHHGWRDDSSWARGLTWSMYGFGTVYTYTGDSRFLQTAELNAQYYMEHTQHHGVPPNDWTEANPASPYESSAAAIGACGFFQLARLVSDPVRARAYHEYACQIMETLTGPEFLAEGIDGWEGIMRHGIYLRRRGLGVNESVMWGEYFFLEALSRAMEYE